MRHRHRSLGLAVSIGMSLGAGVASGRMLTATIQHSEELPPVSQKQEVGQIFQSTTLYKRMMFNTKRNVQKFAIPAWLAGTWNRSEMMETSRVQLPSGKHLPAAGKGVARVTDRFGSYKDASGVIWQLFDPKHGFGSVDRGDAMDTHVVSKYDIVNSSPKTVVVEVTAMHAVMNKKTFKLLTAYQDEELNTYTLVGDGTVRTDSSVKMFNTLGKPMFLTKSVSTERRTAPFNGPLSK